MAQLRRELKEVTARKEAKAPLRPVESAACPAVHRIPQAAAVVGPRPVSASVSVTGTQGIKQEGCLFEHTTFQQALRVHV